MNFKDYCESTTRTFNYQTDSIDLTHCVFGMVEEVGEIAGKFKKIIGYGHKISKTGILEEVGDFMFYFCMLFNLLGVEKIDEEEMSGKDIVARFNGLISSIQRPTIVTKGELHSIALSKVVSALISHIEEGNSNYIIATMENTIIIVNLLCGSLGKTMSKVLESNVDKLKVRYPDKFNIKGTHEEGRDREEELRVIESRTSKEPKPTGKD